MILLLLVLLDTSCFPSVSVGFQVEWKYLQWNIHLVEEAQKIPESKERQTLLGGNLGSAGTELPSGQSPLPIFSGFSYNTALLGLTESG